MYGMENGEKNFLRGCRVGSAVALLGLRHSVIPSVGAHGSGRALSVVAAATTAEKEVLAAVAAARWYSSLVVAWLVREGCSCINVWRTQRQDAVGRRTHEHRPRSLAGRVDRYF